MRVVAAGAVGSAAIAVASYRVGAVVLTPVGRPEHSGATWPARLLFFAGLATLALAWLALARGLDAARNPLRRVRVATGAWTIPLLAALPLQSRDAWLYLAEGKLAATGADPYRVGPGVLTGPLADQVSARWHGQPAPYGPLWLLFSKAADEVAGDRLELGVLLLRIGGVVGLVLLAVAAPALARAAGLRPDVASWVVVANPFVLVSVLGGAHNDLLMTGLLAAGLTAVARARRTVIGLAGGALLVAAAGLVKAPAFAALPFLVPVRFGVVALPTMADARGGLRSRWRAFVAPYVLVGGVAAGAAAAVSYGSGFGIGWVHQLGRSAGDPYGWISFVNPFVFAGQLLSTGAVMAPDPASTLTTVVDAVATLAALVVLAVLWWGAHRGRPLGRLALGLLAVVVLAPTIRPWYLCWPLALGAAVLRSGRALLVVTAVSFWLVGNVDPGGASELLHPVGLAVLVTAVVVAARLRRGFLDPHPVAGNTLGAT